MKYGIHFDMEDEEYHKIPALSASGIKNILISAPDFWVNSWMNPNKKESQGDHFKIGKAFHKRILEGKDKFYAKYALDFDKSNYPNALWTADDLKTACRNLSLPVSGTKNDLADRLFNENPNIEIGDDLKEDYKNLHHGKEFLSDSLINDIEISAAMIEKHPQLSKAFTGGYPEVTVLWHEDGVDFKSRFDYLKPKAIIDLKTFANKMSKPIDSAIYYAMASNKYHIQASFYLRAVDKAVEFAKEWDIGDRDLHPRDNFLKELRETKQHEFYFVFQQKGDAPLARGYKFPRNQMWSVGETVINDAIMRFKQYRKAFGEAMWVDTSEITTMEDGLFPVFATEL